VIFEDYIDHSTEWVEDNGFTEIFKKCIQLLIESGESSIPEWDRVFQVTRPIKAHIVKVELKSPFGNTHSARVRFSCYQPIKGYKQKVEPYWMCFSVDHDDYLARHSKKIKFAFNTTDPVIAVAAGARVYEQCLNEFINRVYLLECNEI